MATILEVSSDEQETPCCIYCGGTFGYSNEAESDGACQACAHDRDSRRFDP